MLSEIDQSLLRRALRLAMNGRGRVEPNPMVACVLARDGRVIGEGFHGQFGGPHAEPTALAACTEDPRGATAYVTLEPCCHTNKKTPPCAPRLIAAGIARVVIGCLDPNPDVNGNGVAMLRAAGIRVDPAPDELAHEFRQLIAPFVLQQQHHRPYITLKWAQDPDGLIAGDGGRPVRISGPAATRAVHRLRTRSHAIAVGVGTVLSDDPQLTVRDVPIINTPARIILDRTGRTPPTARMLNDGGPAVRIVQSLDELADLQGKHLLIEPGPTLASALLSLADRLWVIRSPYAIEAADAPRAPNVPDYYAASGTVSLGDDVLTEYVNTRSPAYFASVPSADLVLTGSPT